MSETYSHETLRDAYECGRRDALAASQSVIAPPELAGPSPVVGSGGVVGLRVESVRYLIERWGKRAGQWKTDASNHRLSKDPAAKISAERCDGRAAIYAACIEDLRAEMASANLRQPEPNDKGEPTPLAAPESTT